MLSNVNLNINVVTLVTDIVIFILHIWIGRE